MHIDEGCSCRWLAGNQCLSSKANPTAAQPLCQTSHTYQPSPVIGNATWCTCRKLIEVPFTSQAVRPTPNQGRANLLKCILSLECYTFLEGHTNTVSLPEQHIRAGALVL